MSFSQLTTKVGNRIKQRIGAILNNTINVFNTLHAFSIDGVNGKVEILNGTDIKFITTTKANNTRIVCLIPKEKFVENKAYSFSYVTDYAMTTLAIGTATNTTDTSSYTKYLNSYDKPLPLNHVFTIDTIDKNYVCIYFYFADAPANQTINIRNITIK